MGQDQGASGLQAIVHASWLSTDMVDATISSTHGAWGFLNKARKHRLVHQLLSSAKYHVGYSLLHHRESRKNKWWWAQLLKPQNSAIQQTA
jgi:hypothetical protein